MIKCICGKPINAETEKRYCMWDFQKNEEVNFCSGKCLTSWITAKQVFMWISVVVGILFFGLALSDNMSIHAASCFLVTPYMIRQVWRRIIRLFNSGVVGEILSLAVLFLGIFTVVYPIYCFVRELLNYNSAKRRFLTTGGKK